MARHKNNDAEKSDNYERGKLSVTGSGIPEAFVESVGIWQDNI